MTLTQFYLTWLKGFLLAAILVDLAWPQPTQAQDIGPMAFVCASYSGVITTNMTWSPADCTPYRITGNVQVQSGATLTILPGTRIEFDASPILTIEGTLTARGTAAQPITFTSSQAVPAKGDWQYIQFNDSAVDATFDSGGNYTGGSIIQYAVIEYAGGRSTSYGAIRLNYAAPYLDHNTIRNNSNAGVYAQYFNSQLRLTGNTILNNNSYGIYAYTSYDNAPISITGNTVSGNGRTGISVYGDNALVSGNTVTNNGSTSYSAGGIYMSIDSYPAQNEGRITGNTITGNLTYQGGGLYVSGKVIINGNLISNNTISSANYGGGIYISSGNPIINYNNIYNNTAGNPATSNNLTTNQTYGNTSSPIDARYNWWGTTDILAIESGLYYYADNTSYNDLLYSPYRSGPVYTVSGQATDGSGKPIGGVQIADGTGRTIMTDANGSYVLGGLDGGSYTLTASRACYTFSPSSRNVTLPPDTGNQDFTGTQTCYAVSGRITKLDSTPLTDATISDGAGHSTTTDATGAYTLGNLNSGNYTLIPSRAGYVFTPTTRLVTVPPDVLGQDFQAGIATYTISGTIRYSNDNSPAAGVTVSTYGGRTTTTLADGTYSFSGLTEGTYRLTPSRSGHTFVPAYLDVAVGPSQGGKDFSDVIPFTISGQVMDRNGAPLPGVTLYDGVGHSTTTNASGVYTFTGLTGGNYTLTLYRSSYFFSPRSRVLLNVKTSLFNQNFTGAIYDYYTPSLLLNYSTGRPGSFFTVVGINYPSYQTVIIKVNGQGVGSVQTDGSGSFTFILATSGQAQVGNYNVTVQIGTSGATISPAASSSATTRYTLDAAATLRPKDGGATDTTFTVSPTIGPASGNSVYLPLIKK